MGVTHTKEYKVFKTIVFKCRKPTKRKKGLLDELFTEYGRLLGSYNARAKETCFRRTARKLAINGWSDEKRRLLTMLRKGNKGETST